MYKTTLTSLSLIALLSACAPVVIGAAATTGMVAAEERTMGEALDDTTIHTQISHHFLQQDIDKLFGEVGIEVNQGRVLLTGVVRDERTKQLATQLAWRAKGVKEVYNEIQVTDTRIKDVARDSLITSDIKRKLLFEKDVRSVNYSVETVNGIVYLFGVTNSQAELEKVTYLASTVKGVKQVVSHVKVERR